MPTDAKLKNIKGTGQPCKVAYRDGLYAMVATSGDISFRYNYRVNGRQGDRHAGPVWRGWHELA